MQGNLTIREFENNSEEFNRIRKNKNKKLTKLIQDRRESERNEMNTREYGSFDQILRETEKIWKSTIESRRNTRESEGI